MTPYILIVIARLIIWIWSYFLLNYSKYNIIIKNVLLFLFLVNLLIIYFLSYGDGSASKWSAWGRATFFVILCALLIFIVFFTGYLLTKWIVHLVDSDNKEIENSDS